MTTVNSIQEAATEIQHQLSQRDFHMRNYLLLDSVQEYLDDCIDKGSEDFSQSEQISNHLTYDLGWEGRECELFPMQL